MKIIIVGCGKIGTTILESLVAEGHEVVGIDNKPEIIKDISNTYDAMYVCGNGTDCDVLSEAGAENAELFVAVTGSDELNMLSCFMAKKLGAAHTIARIRNPEYNEHSLGFIKQQLDLSLAINPELIVAQEIDTMLKLPSAVNIETFSRRKFEMIEVRLKPDSPLDGKKLIDIRKEYDAKFLVCVVQRDEQVFIPGGHFVLKSGDRIGITAEQSEAQKLFRMWGLTRKQARNVMILGASTTSYYLAKLLIASGNTVKIIEQDRERCEEFCNRLPEATIIHGDGARQELLWEEGIRRMDAFVALTGMDEENILLSFFAASENVTKVVPKVNRPELAGIAENLGLDSIVSPKKVVSDILSRYARALQNSLGSRVETLYKLMDGKAEALEFNVSADFGHLDRPLRELELKDNILIAGIIRGRKTIIPSGSDSIQSGDKVIVLASGTRLQDLSDIIRQ